MVLAVTYPWASASSYLSSQSVADSRCNPHATPRSSYSRRSPSCRFFLCRSALLCLVLQRHRRLSASMHTVQQPASAAPAGRPAGPALGTAVPAGGRHCSCTGHCSAGRRPALQLQSTGSWEQIWSSVLSCTEHSRSLPRADLY